MSAKGPRDPKTDTERLILSKLKSRNTGLIHQIRMIILTSLSPVSEGSPADVARQDDDEGPGGDWSA